MPTARTTRTIRTALPLAALLAAGTAGAQTISTLPAEYNFLADAYTGANYRYVGENFVVPGGPGNGFLKALTVGVEGWSGSPEQVQLRTFVYAWDGNRPTGSALYTSPIFSPPATRGFEWHTFAPNVQLTVGGSYVFFLSGVGLPQPNDVTFYGIAQRGTTVQDAYVPGIRVNADDPDFSHLGTTTWFKSSDRDIAFELGFGPSAVATAPEPGTWALLGSGLVLVGGVAARRRRTA
jgi:hypothetical protein